MIEASRGLWLNERPHLTVVHFLCAWQASKKLKMENSCFICGVNRFTLDTKGDGFTKHIKLDHNMWDCAYWGTRISLFLREARMLPWQPDRSASSKRTLLYHLDPQSRG